MYGVTRPVAARDRAGDKAVMAEAGKRERAASLAAAAGHATVVKDAQQAATRRDRYAIAQRDKLCGTIHAHRHSHNHNSASFFWGGGENMPEHACICFQPQQRCAAAAHHVKTNRDSEGRNPPVDHCKTLAGWVLLYYRLAKNTHMKQTRSATRGHINGWVHGRFGFFQQTTGKSMQRHPRELAVIKQKWAL
jgi:hypothetical protein